MTDVKTTKLNTPRLIRRRREHHLGGRIGPSSSQAANTTRRVTDSIASHLALMSNEREYDILQRKHVWRQPATTPRLVD